MSKSALMAVFFLEADGAELPGADEIAGELANLITRQGYTHVLIYRDRHPKWRVTVPVWNIRSAPAMLGSTVMGQLHQGDVVEELESNADWVRHSAGWSGKRGMAEIKSPAS